MPRHRLCFNPRVREGRDAARAAEERQRQVSIHASVKDATVILVVLRVLTIVSIHASVKDATHHFPQCARSQSSFNPRVREGRDLTMRRGRCMSGSFNPRVREGRDIPVFNSVIPTASFNPRVREGRDRKPVISDCHRLSFNPRVREGRDVRYKNVLYTPKVSIHASVKDATQKVVPNNLTEMFQSTRP